VTSGDTLSTIRADRAGQRHRPQLADAFPLLGVVIFAMAVVAYGGVWIWPPNTVSPDQITDKLYEDFRLLVWAVISVGMYAVFLAGDIRHTMRVIAPYAPFVAVAIVSALASDSPKIGLWFCAQWLVMAIAASMAGRLAPRGWLQNAGNATFGAVVIGSLLLALLWPSLGMEQEYAGRFLRGMFDQKNETGWFAALAVVWLSVFGSGKSKWLGRGLALAALVLLLVSRSKTPLAMLLGGATYYVLLRAIQGAKMSNSMKMFLTTALTTGEILLIWALAPILIDLAGKDPTLSGRTTIWSLYLSYLQGSYVLGRGPGFLSWGSNATQVIATYMPTNSVVYGIHSMYLSLFGEIGASGLALYLGALLYVALIAPLRRSDKATTCAAIFAVMILGDGITETRDTLLPSLGTFLLLVARSSGLSSQPAQTST